MWKEVIGYEGYYEVSDDGIVRSVDRIVTKSNGVVQHRTARIMSQRFDADGYKRVKLSRNGVSKWIPVHKLVAMSFVPGYKDGMEVNHIDCNRTNNNSWNLEWVSHTDNISYTKLLKRHVSDRDIKGINNPNYGNTTLHEKYVNNPSFRVLQSRPGTSNGRSRPINIRFSDGKNMDFGYLRDAAKYLINNGYVKSVSNIDTLSTNLRIAAESGIECYGLVPTLL